MILSKSKITILLLFVTVATQAQKFTYDIDFISYFDNREYKEPFQIPQTIFAFRFAPTAGVIFTDTLQGTHSVMLGTHYIQPIGANLYESKLLPTAYYGFQQKGFALHLGAIPYNKRIAILPHFLMYDSCAYSHPNIQGGIFQYSSKLGFAEFMCDWRGAQSPERREMFRLILNGQFKHKWFFTGGFAQLNHKANFAKPTPREGIADDAYINAYVGTSLGEIVEKIDSLSIKCGYIFGFQRDRSVDQTICPQGVLGEIYFKWQKFGFSNSIYVGDNLMPFYNKYKNALNQGDPFYQSKFYNRLDIFAFLIDRKFVKCYFSWNLHTTEHKKTYHQQQLIAIFNLDAIKGQKNKRKLYQPN